MSPHAADDVDHSTVTQHAVGHDDARLEVNGAVAVLRLNRPRVHNVVRMATIDCLERHLARLDTLHDVRVVVLTGNGASFCAGSDLAELSELQDREQGLTMSPRMHRILDRLESGPQVVLGALNGGAYGGGCELITACHLRLASTAARFSFRQASLGLTTGWGGGARLFRLVGRAAALRLLLTAATIDADEAKGLGLVDQLVPPDDVETAALRLAHDIAANQATSLQGFLDLAQAVGSDSWEHAVDTERRLFAERWRGEVFWQRVADWKARKRGA